MTFEELHEAVEGENAVDDKDAAKLIDDFYKHKTITKIDILNNISEALTESIIFLNEKYYDIIDLLCLLKYEPVSVYENKTVGEIADFLKICIKQLNRIEKKLYKYCKKCKQ